METCTPSRKRVKVTSTVTCDHKFTAILVVAITAVATAALSSILRSTLYILQKQTFTVEYQKVGFDSQGPFEVFESVETAPHFSQNSTESDGEHHLNLVFVLDFWERMINIQSGLRRLVNIGVESGFTVVEPFMYESRIQPSYSDPYHFTAQNMTPQPAMKYFQTEDLSFTNSYMSYDEGIKRIERAEGFGQNATKTYIKQAAVFFDWSNSANKQKQQGSMRSSSPFRWCDDKLHTMVASHLGYMLSATTFIERAVCLSVNHTMSPSVLTPQYFHSLFQFVRNGTNNTNRRCNKCVSLAFMNYRKHVFNGFQSNFGTHPFKQKVPPLQVSEFGRALGERIRIEVLRKRPYVAFQMRTGKMFTLFERYENKLLKEGVTITRYSSFNTWLQNCTRKISSAVKKEGALLGRRAAYYIASDMFNEGWKGGERCPEEVEKALDAAKRYLTQELHPIYRFDPIMFEVEQDRMGTSGIADAAVSREADSFIFAKPSNFGRWVAEQREILGRGEAVRVDCTDERVGDE